MPALPSFPPVTFDFGAAQTLPGELAARGIERPLIITDTGLSDHGVVRTVLSAFPDGAAPAVFDGIPPNPTIAGIETALAVYRERNCDGIVGLGGGSVLDSGKALRVAATHAMPVIDFLKDPSKITADVAPYVTIPTTAGTGAEITFGGGIHIEPGSHQLGIRSIHVKPDLAICDPELTLTLPPRLTAATGMDAFGHCIEGFLSSNVNPPTEAIALDGISIRRARYRRRQRPRGPLASTDGRRRRGYGDLYGARSYSHARAYLRRQRFAPRRADHRFGTRGNAVLCGKRG